MSDGDGSESLVRDAVINYVANLLGSLGFCFVLVAVVAVLWHMAIGLELVALLVVVAAAAAFFSTWADYWDCVDRAVEVMEDEEK